MANRYDEMDLDFEGRMDEEEMDGIKATLAGILMKDTEMDKDLIYNLVFYDGNDIIWH